MIYEQHQEWSYAVLVDEYHCHNILAIFTRSALCLWSAVRLIAFAATKLFYEINFFYFYYYYY